MTLMLPILLTAGVFSAGPSLETSPAAHLIGGREVAGLAAAEPHQAYPRMLAKKNAGAGKVRRAITKSDNELVRSGPRKGRFRFKSRSA